MKKTYIIAALGIMGLLGTSTVMAQNTNTYEIEYMSPASGDLLVPGTGTEFYVQLNASTTDTPTFTVYDKTANKATGLENISMENANPNANGTEWKYIVTSDDVSDTFVVGNECVFKLTIGAQEIDGYTWTIVAASEEGETEAQTIIPGELFELEGNGSGATGYPLWKYTPEEDVANYYFTVPDRYFNIFEENIVVFATDPEGKDIITLTAVKTPNGEYVYTGENLEQGNDYYVILLDQYNYLQMALCLEEYKAGENPDQPQYGEIELGEPFSTEVVKSWAITPTSDLGKVNLSTTYPNNLLEGQLTIKADGYDITDGWTAVKTTTGWAYNSTMTNAVTYVITCEENVSLTLKQGTVQPASMSPAQISYVQLDEAAVYLYWNETISQVDSNELIEAYIKYPNMASDANDIYITGDITTYNPENEEGLSDNAVMFDVTNIVKAYGKGTYTISFASNQVMNSASAVNPSANLTFDVTTSGVNVIGAAIEEGAVIYNLQGQKVTNPAKGSIYIINGKKVMIKGLE